MVFKELRRFHLAHNCHKQGNFLLLAKGRFGLREASVGEFAIPWASALVSFLLLIRTLTALDRDKRDRD